MVIRRWRWKIFWFWKFIEPGSFHGYKPNDHIGIIPISDLILIAYFFYRFIKRHALCDDIGWCYLSAANFRARRCCQCHSRIKRLLLANQRI